MKTIFFDANLGRLHKETVTEEDVPQPPFPVNTGMVDIIKDTLMEFDFFGYLQRVYGRSGSQLYIIEGGCGVGNALVDLKRGVKVDVPENELDYTPPQLRRKLIHVNGRYYDGLEGKIHTTGVTSTRRHVDTASSVEERHQINEMIVGPIEQYTFEREYDFVLDFKGAAFHFPRQVIPVYGKILKDLRPGFVRLHTGKQYTGEQLEFEDFRKLFYQSGFEIVSHTDYKLPLVDFLVESNKMMATR